MFCLPKTRLASDFKDVVEAVTGTDIATEIAEIIGGIGAMLL